MEGLSKKKAFGSEEVPKKSFAMACVDKGKNFQPFEYELKPLGKSDCTIKVISCGICGTDNHMQCDSWGVSHFPLIPGHEIIGRVVEVGEAVQNVKPGAIVGLGCIAQSCENCANCEGGKQDIFCDKVRFTYWHEITDETGTYQHHGGFSQYVRTPASKVIVIPNGIDHESGGPLFCAGSTVFPPLFELTGSTSLKGKTIGVVGVGGLGHLAVKFASAMGADDVVAFSRSDSKKAFAKELGCSKYVNTSNQEELENSAGIDLLLVCISGGKFDCELYFPVMNHKGKIHFCGIPDEQIKVSVFGPLLIKGLSISSGPVGSTYQSKLMLDFAAKKKIAPIVEKFPVSEANKAMGKVVDGSIRFRAVLLHE